MVAERDPRTVNVKSERVDPRDRVRDRVDPNFYETRKHDPNSSSGSGSGKKDKGVTGSEKVEKAFKFVDNVIDLLFLVGSKFILSVWNIARNVILHTTGITLSIAKTFQIQLLISFWVFVAFVIIFLTASGWIYMGVAASPKLEAYGIMLTPTWGGLIFLGIGLVLNVQQFQGSLWQIKTSVANAWNAASEGKTDLKTAATKPKNFLVAKERRETKQSQFLEMFIQVVYHVLMGTDVMRAIPTMFAMLVLPEKAMIKVATQLMLIEHKLM